MTLDSFVTSSDSLEARDIPFASAFSDVLCAVKCTEEDDKFVKIQFDGTISSKHLIKKVEKNQIPDILSLETIVVMFVGRRLDNMLFFPTKNPSVLCIVNIK